MNVYKLFSGDHIVLDKVERVICYTENSGYGGIYGYMLKVFFDSGKEVTYKYNEREERNAEYDRIVEQLKGQEYVLDKKEEAVQENSEESGQIAERIYKALLGTEHIKALDAGAYCDQWVSRWRLEDINRVFKEFGVEV